MGNWLDSMWPVQTMDEVVAVATIAPQSRPGTSRVVDDDDDPILSLEPTSIGPPVQPYGKNS